MRLMLEVDEKKKVVTLNGEEYNFNELGITFKETPLVGVMSFGYMVEMLKDYHNYPNTISLSRKLGKYKK